MPGPLLLILAAIPPTIYSVIDLMERHIDALKPAPPPTKKKTVIQSSSPNSSHADIVRQTQAAEALRIEQEKQRDDATKRVALAAQQVATATTSLVNVSQLYSDLQVKHANDVTRYGVLTARLEAVYKQLITLTASNQQDQLKITTLLTQ